MARTRTLKIVAADEAKTPVSAGEEKVTPTVDASDMTSYEYTSMLEKKLAAAEAELAAYKEREAMDACEADNDEFVDDIPEEEDDTSEEDMDALDVNDSDFDDADDMPEEEEDDSIDTDEADFDESPMISDDLVTFTSADGRCIYIPIQLVSKFEDAILCLEDSEIPLRASEGSAQGTTDDGVNHPAHYQGKNECIDAMIALFGVEAVKHFCACNAYKYRFRSQSKDGSKDIAKAEFYETMLIQLGGVDCRAKGAISQLKED